MRSTIAVACAPVALSVIVFFASTRALPLAYFGVASTMDAQGKTADATKQFEQLRRQFPNDAVAEETRLALGRLYEAQNRPADAYKLYDELVKGNPYSGLGSEAGVRLADLVEKHPELAKTNQPPMMTTMPPPLMLTNPMAQGTNRPNTNRTIQIRPMTNTMQRPSTNLNAGSAPLTTLPSSLPTNPPVAAKP